MSKSILIIDTPSSCDNCSWCILMDLYRCTVNKRPPWCPLKEEKEAIPIDFLEKWFGDNYNALTDLEIAWEKENEAN